MAVEGRIVLKTINEHNLTAKKILAHLNNGPLRLRDVWKLAVQDSSGVNKSIKVFYWLRNNGYIRKTGCKHVDPYEITEKGRALLACI